MYSEHSILSQVMFLMYVIWCWIFGSGTGEYDHTLVRQAAALVRRLPVMESPQFDSSFLTVRLLFEAR